MRTMMKVQIPTPEGNAGITSGTLPALLEKVMKELKPEAAYFFSEDGMRTAYIFFDMTDASQIPPVAEPLFMGLNASVGFRPVMNAEDLEKGLRALA